ncbi:MAG: (2Fe-2S)-binding protein [Candidatus Heimdallarchaeota archaeon]|nr:(2Fe-2S)-binding protein [Candidatus Heimdallarchaeota archaeon]
MELKFKVNGQEIFLQVNPNDSLLYILRDRLHLTGTKNGCSAGHCGACVVIMNEEAVKSCLQKAKRLNNAEIITIEGLTPKEPSGELHPIQQAFIDATAIQCGFCTPGYIMELYGLFLRNPEASLDEIKVALEGHLCRCTGFKPILEAAVLAQQYLNKK